MRVTDKMIFEGAARTSQLARDRMNVAMRETSTGLRVTHPGDDPGAAGVVVSRRYGAERLAAIAASVARASDELAAADEALGSLGDLVSRAQQIAVQYSNSTYSESQREIAAREVSILIDHAVALLNTRIGGRYIFGGNTDGAKPFAQDGSYHGDEGVRQVEIAPGVLADASVRADVAAKGAGGGIDVLATMQDLMSTLEDNDVDGVRGTLDRLDVGVIQVAKARSTAGAQMSVLDTAVTVAKTGKDALVAEISHLEDADPFESASNLALAQRALDAALTASASSFQLTLINKLR